MQEMFADLHVHIGRSENGKPIKITANTYTGKSIPRLCKYCKRMC